MKLILDEEAQPDPYIRRNRIRRPFFRFLIKLKDFKCALWSEKYGRYIFIQINLILYVCCVS